MNDHNQDDHFQRQKVVWDYVNRQIRIGNIDPLYVYLLITNSLHLLNLEPVIEKQQCYKCHHPISNILYQFDMSHLTQKEVQKQFSVLKFCILLIHKQTNSYSRMLGTVDQNECIKGNLVANEKIIHSQLFIRQPTESPIKMLISSMLEPNSQQKRYQNMSSTLQIESSFIQGLSADQQEYDQYCIYVTKMQAQIQNLNRSHMFYQYIWQPNQIQFVMNKTKEFFGQFKSIVQKRRYLCFTFRKHKNDTAFKTKWENTNRELMFRKNKLFQGKILNYYIISKEQVLQNEQLTSKLFLLPNNQNIVDVVVQHPWVIIAAQHYVIFLHNYKPMEFFKHESCIIPNKIIVSKEHPNHIIIINKKGSFFFYTLTEMTVTLEAVYHIPFLIPHTMTIIGSQLAFAGLDLIEEGIYSKQNYSLKRKIYLIHKQLRKQSKNKNRSLNYKQSYEIMEVNQEDRDEPISNILSLSRKDLMLCCWKFKAFLISLNGQKLVQVSLKYKISKIFQVPFLFNIFNFILITTEGEMIRMGIESYGQGLATEMNRLNTANVKDACQAVLENSRFEVFICKEKKINKVSYLNQNGKHVLQQKQGQIIKLASDRHGIAYLVDLSHSIEVKYLQM